MEASVQTRSPLRLSQASRTESFRQRRPHDRNGGAIQSLQHASPHTSFVDTDCQTEEATIDGKNPSRSDNAKQPIPLITQEAGTTQIKALGSEVSRCAGQSSVFYNGDTDEQRVLKEFYISDSIQLTTVFGQEHLLTEGGSMQWRYKEMRIIYVGGRTELAGGIHVEAIGSKSTRGWMFPSKSIGQRIAHHRQDVGD